jgi:hypothetical protein
MGAINKGKAQLKAAKDAVSSHMTSLYATIQASASGQFEANKRIKEKGGSLKGAKSAFTGFGQKMKDIGKSTLSDVQGAMTAAGATIVDGEYTLSNDEAKDAIDRYRKTSTGRGLTDQQVSAMKKKPHAALTELEKAGSSEAMTAYKQIDDVNAKRMGALSKATGKSTAELEILAQTMGIDLYNPTVKYNELLTEFTEGIIKTGAALNDALVDVFLTGANPFKQTREANEKSAALNQNMAGLGDVLRSGASKGDKSKAIGASMEQQFAQLLAVNGGDATKAYLSYNEMYGQGETGGVFAKGAALEGQGKTVLGDKDFAASQELMKQGMVGEASTQISTRLAKKNMSVDPAALQAALAQKTPAELAAILGDISNFEKNSSVAKGGEQNKLKKAIGGKKASDVQSGLEGILGSGIAVTADDPKKLDTIAEAATGFKDSATALEAAVTTFNTNMSGFFKAPLGDMPEWWNKGLKVEEKDGSTRLVPGDTSTPRGGAVGDTATSKLSQTMGRHAAMNGQLTGTRTVTSSLRDYALGSINSDHATGSAYDLTGQNLGQYAKLVHANGGFAEFHGSMANRHLHVVPGSGMGDTSTPSPVSTSSSSGGGTNNYYTFEINGNNAAPEVIANMVMAKIQEKERSDRQRR